MSHVPFSLSSSWLITPGKESPFVVAVYKFGKDASKEQTYQRMWVSGTEVIQGITDVYARVEHASGSVDEVAKAAFDSLINSLAYYVGTETGEDHGQIVARFRAKYLA